MPGKVGGALPAPVWVRFWAKVDRTDGCWLWTGAYNDSGYGAIYDGRRLVYAHRLSWVLHGGVIPDGMTIDHLCHVKLCVNPAHLEVVPRRVNSDRSFAHLREIGAHPWRQGDNHPRAKLTSVAVVEMRRRWAAGESMASLAREHGVSTTVASLAIRRRTWKHVA